MPNWCECDLTVSGPTGRVEEVLEFSKGEDSAFDFNRFIPYPEEFEKMDEAAEAWERENLSKPGIDWCDRPKSGFASGGYDWCVRHWGTKWTAHWVTNDPPQVWKVAAGYTTVAIQFETAWSPPLPVIQKAAELFPELELDLRYFECGVQVNGVFLCREGQVVANEAGEYFGWRGG